MPLVLLTCLTWRARSLYFLRVCGEGEGSMSLVEGWGCSLYWGASGACLRTSSFVVRVWVPELLMRVCRVISMLVESNLDLFWFEVWLGIPLSLLISGWRLVKSMF